MEHQDQDREQDNSEEVMEIPTQNLEGESNALDPQTLENLAAFLTGDNSESKQENEHEHEHEHEHDDERNRSEEKEE
jgi:hypothetical protein